MKKTVVLISGVLIFLGGCIPPKVNQISSAFAGKTKDEVFMAARIALVEAQYNLKTDDKDRGLLVGAKIEIYGSVTNPAPLTIQVFTDARGTSAMKITYPERYDFDDTTQKANRLALEKILSDMNRILR